MLMRNTLCGNVDIVTSVYKMYGVIEIGFWLLI